MWPDTYDTRSVPAAASDGAQRSRPLRDLRTYLQLAVAYNLAGSSYKPAREANSTQNSFKVGGSR